jgi:hypothetical protein
MELSKNYRITCYLLKEQQILPMIIDDNTLNEAIKFLIDGGEQDAADILKTCSVENFEIVDNWMNGSEQLDGLSIELRGPRTAHEILSRHNHQLRKEILSAFSAVLPGSAYIKNLRIRAVTLSEEPRMQINNTIPIYELKELIQNIEAQKGLMITVATGGPKIKDVNAQYRNSRFEILTKLQDVGIDDPNPYPDLWSWYGKWSDGSLPSWQSRRKYIGALYQPLLDALTIRSKTTSFVQPQEPTGWARVDRNIDKIDNALAYAKNEEDFQTVGLLCREAIISLAQAVYDSKKHSSVDGVSPSNTDAKRMLENYIAAELVSNSNETHRKFAKTTVQLAVDLQHKRTTTFREAALCAEATRSIINTIAIMSGQRDPDK